MIQVEPIQNFKGFGTNYQPGEYFFSQGMMRSQFGITPKLSITSVVTQATLSNLQILNWLSEGQFSSTKFVYGYANDGRLYKSTAGTTSWSLERSVAASVGNGMIFDQKNRLLYARNQYLGKSDDGSTFDDSWKDFTITHADYRPMDTYEDWVAIGNRNKVALLNVTDDSFNASGFDLPSGFNIRCLKAGRSGILIGANFNNRGALILWEPNQIRSIAPWIWRNRKIQSIITIDDGWIVITQNEILITNGYSVQPLVQEFPDYLLNDLSILASVAPQATQLNGDNLLFWGFSSRFNRQKAGLYILNLTTRLFEFIPVSNSVTNGVTGGAMITDSEGTTHLSYQTTNPDTKFIGFLSNNPASRVYLITEPLGQGDNEKVAEGVKLTFGVSSYQSITPAMTFNVSVKVCSTRRNVFGRAVTRAVSTSYNVLKIDGSIATANGINKAQVGDEITILEGVNAGKVAHITNISGQGTNTEEWGLDTSFSEFTETSINMNVSPFKLVRKYSLSDVSELKALYFDIQNRIKGKKFFVKILIENLPTGFMPELTGGQFIFDDMGVIK